MNYDPETFKVLLKYPDRKAIRWEIECGISEGKIVVPKEKLLDTKSFIETLVENGFRDLRKIYDEAQKEANNAFRASLEEDNGNSSFTQAAKDAIWSKSWQDGHSGGYGDITNHYIANVEFVEEILGIKKNGY